MSDLLGIGVSGIKAYGNALAAIGNNVSNAATPGYTRRDVTLQQNTSADATQLYYTNRTEFSGVTTTSVTRAWNDYQAAAARTASGEAGSADAKYTWLSNAENALNDTATGVGQSATAFFGAGTQLAADPSNTGSAKQFMSDLNQTVSAFNQTATALANVSQGIGTSAQTTVQTVNATLDALDKVNSALTQSVSGSSSQADLEDQRDQLLDNLSNNVGITVTLSGNGVATVKLTNSNIQLNSNPNGSGGSRLMVTAATNGTLSVQAVSNGGTQVVTDPGGELGGMVSAAGTVADRRNSLNQMASDFATAVNAWQAQGKTSAGTAGAPLLSGTDASSLTMATTDTSAIASASSDGTSNGNLLALANLRGSTGLEQTWNGMVTDQGQMVSTANAQNTAASQASDSAFSARDSTSGVDINTEAAEMIRYQQAYNGAAKVIQTAKDTMQSILDLF
jgi:flagellar hook-associated protein 1 FlgK